MTRDKQKGEKESRAIYLASPHPLIKRQSREGKEENIFQRNIPLLTPL